MQAFLQALASHAPAVVVVVVVAAVVVAVVFLVVAEPDFVVPVTETAF